MSKIERPLIIIGCGGHGRVLGDIARACGLKDVTFLDDSWTTAPPILRVTGPIRSELPRYLATHNMIVAIGHPATRRELSQLIIEEGGVLATLLHPAAVVAPDVTIGAGTAVMAGVVINTGTRIGRFAVVNTGAIVDHDNTVEDNVHISPGCNLAGTVTCRRDSFVGTGASIIPRVIIGEAAYVAAGATVIRDVRPRTLVAGCPAVEKKEF